MAVSSLAKLIKEEAPEAIVERDFKEYSGKKCVIDGNMIIYRFVLAIMNGPGGEKKTKAGKRCSHIFGIYQKTRQLLKNNMVFSFCFDGNPPKLKKKTLQERKKNKEKAVERLSKGEFVGDQERVKLMKRTYRPSGEEIIEVQELLKLMGIAYIQCVGEADPQCAVTNLVYDAYVVSEDLEDILLFGGINILKNFSNKKKVQEVNKDIILNKLKLTHEEFVELGIIIGTDYCPGIKGINAYQEYYKFKDMEKFLKYIKQKKCEEEAVAQLFPEEVSKIVIPENFEQKWQEIKEYYLNCEVINPYNIEFLWREPDYQGLKTLLINKYEFDAELVENEIRDLAKLHQFYKAGGFQNNLNFHAFDKQSSSFSFKEFTSLDTRFRCNESWKKTEDLKGNRKYFYKNSRLKHNNTKNIEKCEICENI